MHSPLLQDLVVLLVMSIGVLYLSQALRLPGLVSFLISGVLVGPYGLGLVHDVEQVEALAEIGVIFLLFTIGLEFSLAELLRIRRLVLVGGAIQVAAVTAVVFGALTALGVAVNEALFLGMIAALSSTAVVLRLLQQRAEVDAPHGRASLAILVFQDLTIVPMTLLVPVLAGQSNGLAAALGMFVVKTVAVLLAVVVLARFVVPQVLDRVVQTRNRDLFLLTVVTICLAVAWAAGVAGLSLALGAFLAGLLISESEYSHQALAEILPFRDLFASFFFISIGMLLDVQVALDNAFALLALVVGVLAVKTLAAAGATLALGMGVRAAASTGLTMNQVGEFSFVLAGTGLAAGLLTPEDYQWFVAVAVLTIGITPAMLWVAPGVAEKMAALPLPERLRAAGPDSTSSNGHATLEGHVVVIGYGVNGRNVARAASIAGIACVAVDMNPRLVAEKPQDGVQVHYGDATRQAFLEHLCVPSARAVVIAISDTAATRRITALVRALNPGCTIIARTRYMREVEALSGLGATAVIPEELETSIEIVSRLLAGYLVPRPEIDAFVSEIRAGSYQMLRSSSEAGASFHDLRQTLTDVEVTTLRVREGCPLIGQRLVDTELRRVYGVSVVAIRRAEVMRPNPGRDEVILLDDRLVVLGLGEEIAAVTSLMGGNGDGASHG